MTARHRAPRGLLLGSLVEAADLVLSRECGGCARSGTVWCASCAALLTCAPARRVLASSTSSVVAWSTARYEAEVRRAVVAWKDRGRADLTRVLAAALRRAVQAALVDVESGLGSADGASVLLVPAPSSRRARRQRGHDPVHDLARQCGPPLRRRGVEVQVVPALVHARQVSDQARLGAEERARNLAGAIRAGRGWGRELVGRRCLVVDDVVTTGATVLECARALRAAGATVLGAAAVAGTPLRGGAPTASSSGPLTLPCRPDVA